MRDIMAQLRYLDAEQEARANRQQIARTIRAGKQRAPQSPHGQWRYHCSRTAR